MMRYGPLQNALVPAAVAALLALFTGCASDTDDRRSVTRYGFQPGPIANQYLHVGMVRPPVTLHRRVWSSQAPRGKFRALSQPQRVILTGEPEFRRGVDNPETYLAQLQQQVWQTKSWGDVPAHYYIVEPGVILGGRDERLAGAVASDVVDASNAFVISLMGHYGDRPPATETMEVLAHLTAYLCDHYRVAPASVVSLTTLDPAAAGPGRFVENYLTSGWIERRASEIIKDARDFGNKQKKRQ